MGIHNRFQTEAEPQLKEPPRSIPLEQALIGAILVNNKIYEDVRGIVQSGDFFDPVNRRVYATMAARIEAGRAAPPTTMAHELADLEPTQGMNGPQYLGWLAANVTSLRDAAAYARELRALSDRRIAMVIAEDLRESAAGLEQTVDALIAATWERLNALRTGLDAERAVSVSDAMAEAIEHANRMSMRGTGLNGLSTGFPGIDAPLGGLSPASLYIAAGRPGMGKSSFGASVAWNIACTGAPALFVSLEMSARDVAGRLLSAMSGAPVQGVRSGIDLTTHIAPLEKAAQTAKAVPLNILDMRDASLGRLTAAIRNQHMRTPLDVVVIDYVQLVQGTAYRGTNRAQEVGEITGALKSLAKELNVPVVALAQLNRDADKRENKRPVLSDLRESGSLEQDADAVLMLYRHEYYLEQSKPENWVSELAEWAGRAEVLIAKNRHGPTATVELMFDGPTASFGNPAHSGGRHAR